MLSTLPLIQAKAIHRQIGDHIRELIVSGKLAPESKLPTTEELAASWGSNPTTIQNALAPLVKEGLLIRVPKRGTFVRKREEKLTCVGVYSGMSVKEAPFSHAVRQVLREELEKSGIEIKVWTDSRPLLEHFRPWKSLIQAAEERRIQAFIGIETNRTLVEWQRKLSVPVSFLGLPSSFSNSVDHDMRQFVEVGLQKLAQQGCRSVGFIAPVLSAPDPEDPECFVRSFDMLGHFTDIASELGLKVKNDWMRIVRDPLQHRPEEMERFGYEQFLKLWNQPEKPDGLFVFYDTTVRGTLMAIREKQVRVPKDLKLALHKNESIELFCPMPATFVVASEREAARALIGQVQKQFRGESCERISLPFKLEAHNNP